MLPKAPYPKETPVPADENFAVRTPEQFHREMERLHTKYLRDPEAFHSRADKLMQETLKGLGYEDGVKVFNKAIRWYA